MSSRHGAGLGWVGSRATAALVGLRRVVLWLDAMRRRRGVWASWGWAGAAGGVAALLAWAMAPVGWAAGPLPALGPEDGGFAQVLGPRGFEFPPDHGPHPEYRQEWWYFTGNLDSGTGERFGFELTFFRFGLTPGGDRLGDAAADTKSEVAPGAKRSAESGVQSAWRARQIYMAHFAVTDVARQRFRFAEKVSRAAVGLAGARNPPLRVWVDDWVLEDVGAEIAAGARVAGSVVSAATGGGAGAQDHGHWKLHAAEEGYELTLDAEALQAPVLNGDRGFSAKSSTPGSASYYYSIPRVAVHGQLVRDGKIQEVHGLAWMDREWGSGSLEQQGWDWFALHLRDGGSLMFYSLRGRDGRRDSHSAGTWVSATGEVRRLAADDVQIDVLDYWKNPRGERYPSRWRVRVPTVGVDVEARPVLADQELTTASRYWEGAVDLVAAGAKSGGRGYVELVGYAAQ